MTSWHKRAAIAAVISIFLVLSLGASQAWSLGLTPGGTIHLGASEIAYGTTQQGLTLGHGVGSRINQLTAQLLGAAQLKPLLANLNGLVGQSGKLLGRGVQQSVTQLGYTLEMEPQPRINLVLTGNDQGIDFTLPSRGGIHLTGAESALMRLLDSVSDTAAVVHQYAGSELSLVQTNLDGVTVVAIGAVGDALHLSKAAVNNIVVGAWQNTYVETCLTVDAASGKGIVLAVPQGTLGGWTPNHPYQQCPVQVAGLT